MRVAVCVDPMCGLSSREAGTAIARAFRAQGDQCVVVPVGQAGLGAAQSLGDILDADPALLVPTGHSGTLASVAVAGDDMVVAVAQGASPRGQDPHADPFAGTSWQVGRALADALDQAPWPAAAGRRRVFLDAGAVGWHDGGAGFLAALGAVTPDAADMRGGARALAGLQRVDLAPASALVQGAELVLLADEATANRHLCGLRGITSVVGHDHEQDLSDMLEVDRHLAGLAAACGLATLATRDGSGAAGGLGFAVQALGGRVVTGFDACRELTGLDRALQLADLVVVGCDQLDFGHWDRFSVLPIARLVDTRVPVVAINRRTHVSQRELRTQDIESAHQLADDAAHVPGVAEITERVRPIAASWRLR